MSRMGAAIDFHRPLLPGGGAVMPSGLGLCGRGWQSSHGLALVVPPSRMAPARRAARSRQGGIRPAESGFAWSRADYAAGRRPGPRPGRAVSGPFELLSAAQF